MTAFPDTYIALSVFCTTGSSQSTSTMSTLSSPKLGSGSINVECFLLICEAITQRMPDPNRRAAMGGRPLNDIRAASQVCRRWREILLASSWIWGRVVDLEIQNRLELLLKPQPRHGRRRADWMEEVVRRVGSASLWTFGDVFRSEIDKEVEMDGRFDTLSSLTRLLSNSWERVEILSIRVSDHGIPEIGLRTLFCSPAHILNFIAETVCGSRTNVTDDERRRSPRVQRSTRHRFIMLLERTKYGTPTSTWSTSYSLPLKITGVHGVISYPIRK